MASFLYNLILFPLVQIIEFVYLLVFGIFHDFSQPEGFAIIGVSVAITLLCLPLYVVAEKWQQVERDTQKKLEPGINRIKSVFKGDEQYMILRTFYRQNGYHPMMALRSSFGLLIQIPFFMAAYQFLSHLETLRGVSFLFIKDLGVPDATFHIGNFPINVLPIAMTLINCISGAIYTKGFKAKDKIQVYGMAALFLVILYQSPAGLVLYWTMNNVFSMVKNIFYKMKKPLLVLFVCACVAVLGIDFYLLFLHSGFFFKRLAVVGVFSLVFFIPLLLKLVKYSLNKPFKDLTEDKKTIFKLFITSTITITLVFGLYIITTVVAASPMEFSYIDNVNSPFYFILSNFERVVGLCLFWPICVYFLFGTKVKTSISLVFSFLAICILVNVFFFSGNYGNINQTFLFDNPAKLRTSNSLNAINLLVLLVCVSVLIFFFLKKKVYFVSGFYTLISFSLVLISFISFGKINKGYKEYTAIKDINGNKNYISPVYHLSKTEKNVLVIDFDRAIGAFIPEILEERPELKEIYSGFIYYPNTASFGTKTLAGSPSIFGGYDYIPQNMMKRDKEPLVDKHNEALKAIPVLFNNNGYRTTVSDLSFANYMWISDVRIFDDYPDINAVNVTRVYSGIWQSEHPDVVGENATSELIKINSFWYSFLRSSPMALREVIYNQERYWNTDKSENELNNLLEQYSAVDYLPELTDFTSEKPTYTVIANDLTHEPMFLQAPDYIPVKEVTDFGPEKYKDESHWHVNMAAFLRFGEFIQYLKDNGVYDNTRIIMVSDHGSDVDTKLFPYIKGEYLKITESVNPILLVKDFNSDFEFKTDYSFMTNADATVLACDGLFDSPVNPFTGNEVTKENANKIKKDGVYGIVLEHWTPDGQNKNTFKSDTWYKTTTNLFDEGSVVEVSEKEALEAAKW